MKCLEAMNFHWSDVGAAQYALKLVLSNRMDEEFDIETLDERTWKAAIIEAGRRRLSMVRDYTKKVNSGRTDIAALVCPIMNAPFKGSVNYHFQYTLTQWNTTTIQNVYQTLMLMLPVWKDMMQKRSIPDYGDTDPDQDDSGENRFSIVLPRKGGITS